MKPGRFDSWIHDSFHTSARGLGAYRIFYAAFALLVVAPGHDAYASLAGFVGLPSSMFAPPPGPMHIFSGFPPYVVAETIHLLLNVSLAALLLGYRTRTASLFTGALFLILYGFSYSLGKINHNVLFVLVPIVMSASAWGEALSLDARWRSAAVVSSTRISDQLSETPTATWPLTLLAVIVGFAIFTAGFAKILGGWLDPSTHAVYGHILKTVFVRGRHALFAPSIVGLESGLVWEVFDYATVFFEIGFLVACAHRRTLRFFAGLAVLFHFGVMMTMNIAYAFNLAAYAAFVDWDRIVDGMRISGSSEALGRIRRARPERNLLHARLSGILIVLIVGAAFYVIGSPLLWLDRAFVLDSDLSAREVLVVTSGALLVLTFGIKRSIPVLRASASEVRLHLRRLTQP